MSHMNSIGIVEYWGGCPETPNSKWQRFLHLLRACSEQGWRTYLVWSHMPKDPSLSRPLLEAGCKILLQPRPRGNFDLGCVRRSYRLFRQVGCDVLHCHNIHTSPLIAAALAGVPVRIWSKLSMSLSYEQGRKPAGIHRFSPSLRTSAMLAHRVLAISHAVHDELLAIGADRRKVVVWPQPIDVDAFVHASAGDIRRQIGLSTTDIVLTAVGRAIPVKGWDILIKAFAQVHRAFPSSHLLLVGSTTGCEEARFAQLLLRHVAELGLAEAVHFLGQRPDIPQVLQCSDVFVLPSRSEGRPLALAEALASGLPCVASRAGGTVDLIKDRYNGLLFEREDVSGLAARLGDVLRDNGLRHQLAERGRRSVGSSSLEHCTRRTVALYEALLRERTNEHTV